MAKIQEERIRSAFRNKTWQEIKVKDSWQIFKIMAEFVDGFEKLAKIGPCVSVFGSARTKPDHPSYEMAVDVARLLTENGYGVVTGGGPGIMEAANKGAHKAGGKSVGLCIQLLMEEQHNKFIDRDKLLEFNYFFVRKVMFTKYSQGFIVLPGGFGTMDELFEALTLIQTKKIGRFPIVLVGKSYWKGLIDWIRTTMVDDHKNIHLDDMDLIALVDDPTEAVKVIDDFYNKYLLSPNF